MKLPRPLLIVVIVVLVLGVAGCSASLVLGQRDRDLLPAAKENELRNGGLGDLFRRLTPPSEPVQLSPANSSCSISNGRLEVTGTCVISVPGTQDLRRRLELRPSGGGKFDMQVDATIGGETGPSETAEITDSTEDASVVLARGDSAVVTITCLLCIVLVNP